MSHCVSGRNQGSGTTSSTQRRVSGDCSTTTTSREKKTVELVLESACWPCPGVWLAFLPSFFGLCCLPFRPLPYRAARSAQQMRCCHMVCVGFFVRVFTNESKHKTQDVYQGGSLSASRKRPLQCLLEASRHGAYNARPSCLHSTALAQNVHVAACWCTLLLMLATLCERFAAASCCLRLPAASRRHKQMPATAHLSMIYPPACCVLPLPLAA